MEHHRKQAKALVRAYRAGELDAIRRAQAVLGARERFLLSDAQHVVAREQGHRTWAELKRATEAGPVAAAIAAMAERDELEVETDLRYGEDGPVVVHVRKRLHRYMLDDLGNGARLARRPAGWVEVAHAIVVDGYSLNVDRRGRVFVPCVHPELHEKLIRRIADASLELYEALLDLDEQFLDI